VSSPLRVQPRGTSPARRACGLSGPTRRASRNRAQETSSTRTTEEGTHRLKTRLLIIAPWVKKSVVNTDFLAKLKQRLRAGVEVTIAHGYGDDDSGSDEQALRRLGNLASRFSRFTFVRVRNTHAKILIYDETWISTSFNWLSFRGDSDRTYRMEEGTLVNIPARVDKEYEQYRTLIEEQRLS